VSAIIWHETAEQLDDELAKLLGVPAGGSTDRLATGQRNEHAFDINKGICWNLAVAYQ